MKCRKCQQLFIPFIDDQLSIQNLKAFLHHMESCKDCCEEFDLYYSMIMGMRYLDEDRDLSVMKLDSKQKLRSANDYLIKYHILRTEKYALFALLCLGLILFL